MSNLYDQYLSLLDLVVKLFFISLQLRGKTALPLLEDSNITASNH